MSSPSDHHDNISEPLLLPTTLPVPLSDIVHLAYLTCVRYGSLTSRRDCSQLHVVVSTPVQWAGISRRGRVVIVYMTSAWHLSSTQPSVGLHRLDSQRRVIEITASQSQHLVHPQLPPNRTHHPSRPCRSRNIKNFKPIRRSCVIKRYSNSRRSAHITRPNSTRLRYRNALYPNHAQNRTVPPELDQSIQIRPRTANLGQQQSPQVVGNSLKKAFERQLLVDTFFYRNLS